jgi:hypothetical protein
MSGGNVIDLSARFQQVLELLVEEVDSPCDEVFIDNDRVIIRTSADTGLAMNPLAAKELAVRLIEAAVCVERG